MSRKSGNRFSDKDMRKAKKPRAVCAVVESETAPEDPAFWTFSVLWRGGCGLAAPKLASTARLRTREGDYAHSSVVCTHMNVAWSLEPRPETAVTIAIDMAATISPYAIVVAPLSSRANRCKSIAMIHALPRPCGRVHLIIHVLRLGCSVP